MKYFTILAAVAVLGVAPAHARSACDGLPGVHVAQVSSVTAEQVAAGPFALPAMMGMPSRSVDLPAFCRVKGVVAPHIGFELWLPAEWNGRLVAVGSGGFGGFIGYGDMAPLLEQGYAVTANDTGHTGTGVEWMHDPAALRAWGHSATHDAIGPAKALTRAFYGKGPVYSYFQGCSTGGAQAMEEAEFYPGDFNGIAAGCPGMAYSRLMLSFLWGLKVSTDHAVLSEEKLQLLHKAVLEQCDAADGLKDGLLSDPLSCHVRLEDLLCKTAGEHDCLTPAEAETVRLIYQGPRNPRTGEQIYPGFAPGSEADAGFTGRMAMAYGWSLIQGPLAKQYAIPLLKNMVFGANWDWRTFDFDKDVERVDKALGSKIDAMNPDLRPFAAHGGKLVMVQGWGDPFNAQTLPAEYRARVVAVFARREGQARAQQTVDGFFQLFMAPGMSHCLGGPGPSKTDALNALRRWVEQGEAPKTLIAETVSLPFGGQPATPTLKRPLCPYPKYPRFMGGDPGAASSFECTAP